MIIYIAGKMSGEVNRNFHNFIIAEKALKQAYPDSTIINPMRLSIIMAGRLGRDLNEIDRQEYMDADLYALKNCDTIALLPNWQNSEGALEEHEQAQRDGLKMIFLNEDFMFTEEYITSDFEHYIIDRHMMFKFHEELT